MYIDGHHLEKHFVARAMSGEVTKKVMAAQIVHSDIKLNGGWGEDLIVPPPVGVNYAGEDDQVIWPNPIEVGDNFPA